MTFGKMTISHMNKKQNKLEKISRKIIPVQLQDDGRKK